MLPDGELKMCNHVNGVFLKNQTRLVQLVEFDAPERTDFLSPVLPLTSR